MEGSDDAMVGPGREVGGVVRSPGSEGTYAPSRGRLWIAGLGLVLLALVVYGRVVSLPFVTFEDPAFVGNNPAVDAGLTLPGIRWALTANPVGNWVPVTWISHMVDVELFGPEPWGHHLSNLIYHATNGALLFYLLVALTGRLWRSLMASAIFVVHPLNVECVAWIVQQKTLVSTLFALLFLILYLRFVASRRRATYIAATLCLGLGLLSKPVLVVLPAVPILLDRWPLNRWTTLRSLARQPRILWEKLPWFGLSGLMAVATFLAQRGAGAVAEGQLAFPLRFANAIVSYVRFLALAVWPHDLTVHYPHPYLPGGSPYAVWQIAGAAVLLVAISAAVLVRRRAPYLAVGWAWFLGVMVPTIGWIQVGEQAMADRYFYLAGIGLILAAVWGAGDLIRWVAAEAAPRVAGALGVVVLLALGFGTTRQLEVWKSSRALYEHTLQIAPSNPIILNNLGQVELTEGRVDRAEELFTKAVALRPFYVKPRVSLAQMAALRGDFEFARQQIDIALELHPNSTRGLVTRAQLALSRGAVAPAMVDLRRALEIDPGYGPALELVRRIRAPEATAEEPADG